MGPTKYTLADDKNTFCVMSDIRDHMSANYPIKGYHYQFLKELPEKYIWESLSKRFPNNKKYKYNTECAGNHNIVPDGGVILLISDDNPKEMYLFLSAENKFQNTGGNAIERVCKNFNLLKDITSGCKILPYVIFASGNSLGNDYFRAKIRQGLGCDPSLRSIYKNDGILFEYQDKGFSDSEKGLILMDVAKDSYDYYKSFLKG